MYSKARLGVMVRGEKSSHPAFALSILSISLLIPVVKVVCPPASVVGCLGFLLFLCFSWELIVARFFQSGLHFFDLRRPGSLNFNFF